MTHSPSIRVGTRGSLLATTQTEWVVARLRAAHPDLSFEVVTIQTTGDVQSSVSYSAVGTKGMFVKEIEQALSAGHIDLGIHSMKDMPGELPNGLCIAAVPEREDPLDAFVSVSHGSLTALPPGAAVGTSSTRRQALLRTYRPDLQVVELRGNLDTRLGKLRKGGYDAIVVACAGLNRLGRGDTVTERLPPQIMLPAVGQGALALEARADDDRTLQMAASIDHPGTSICVTAERSFLAAIGGGCSAPIAAYAQVVDGQIELHALVASPNGARVLRTAIAGPPAAAADLGRQAAEELVAAGGAAMLDAG